MTRKEAACRILHDRHVDAMIVQDMSNIRYLTGYTNDTGVLLLTTDGAGYLLTDFRFFFQAKQEAVGYEVMDVSGNTYAGLLEALMQKHGVKTVAIEQDIVTYGEYRNYRDTLSAETVPVDNILIALRAVKNDGEIELLRKAEQIGDHAFERILADIKPGVTEREIAAKLTYYMSMLGASGNSFPPIVASGVNSSMPHAMPGERVVREGDFITMDFGCIYNGYCSDMTRTVVLGTADERQKAVYNTVLKAQEATLAAIHAGMRGKDIDAVARTIIYEAGYEGCFGHGLGHSVGLQIHEPPYANARSEAIVPAGSMMTVEPGIYIEQYGGVRIEDLVVVTETGCENLTHSPKQLIELPVK